MNNAKSRCSCRLSNEFRLLWSQHVYRTRFFIISTAADLADLPYVTKWLLQNPGDFAMVLGRFYGKNQAETFKNLLTEHLAIAGELVNAAKNQNAAEVNSARKRWYENADKIAEFLSDINPNWSYKKWASFLYDHLRMTENEARLRLTGKYLEDIVEFNNIEQEAMRMADYMTDGINSQFQLC